MLAHKLRIKIRWTRRAPWIPDPQRRNWLLTRKTSGNSSIHCLVQKRYHPKDIILSSVELLDYIYSQYLYITAKQLHVGLHFYKKDVLQWKVWGHFTKCRYRIVKRQSAFIINCKFRGLLTFFNACSLPFRNRLQIIPQVL